MKKIVCMLLAAVGFAAAAPGMSIEEESAINEQKEKALRAGNYQEARRLYFRTIHDPCDPLLHLNIAREYIQLGLISWCLNKDEEARTAISNAILIYQIGDKLGNGCEARAVVLLKRLNRLPRRLSYKELNAVCNFTTEIPDAQWHREMNRLNARYEALARRYGSQTESLRRQGEFQASMAKFYAKQEYESSTRRTFDLNSPPRGGEAREKWNACKRIYDIWGK